MKVYFRTLAAGLLAILSLAPSARAQSPAPAPSVAPEVTGTSDDLSQFHSADDLWAHIQKLQQGPGTDAATPQEVLALLRRLSAAAAEFQARYTKDPRRWDAKLMALQYDSMLASAEARDVDPGQIETVLKAVAAAPDASKEAKAEARVSLITFHAGASGDAPLTDDVDKEILAFVHDYPDDADDGMLQKMRLESLQKSDPDKAAALLETLLKDANPAVADMAQGEVAMRDLMKKPLDLKFTAMDGTKVDVKALRGKVVLIDFWATWCAPCMERVPDLVNLYKELHPKGFEIVGISLDQNKSLVQAVTKADGMAWPQYYDGKGWANEIASRYGIQTIPRMWLVDRKGMVVDAGAEDDLDAKVRKQLE